MPRAIPVPIRRGPTTPTRAGRLADASVDPTEARKATVRRFGRSDRSNREGPSRLNASLFACHHQFAKGYRSGLLRCRRTDASNRKVR